MSRGRRPSHTAAAGTRQPEHQHQQDGERRETVSITLTYEEVHVEIRDVPQRPLQPHEQAFQEGTIRIPIWAEGASPALKKPHT
jgi:hypothetical protein